MATICGFIATEQLKDCSALLTDGNESTLYIANRTDVAGYVRDVTNPQIIRSIVMKTGKRFWRYEGARSTLKPRFTYVRKAFGAKFKHDLDAVIFNWNSVTKKEIMALATGQFIAIVINKDKQGDASVEIYGTDVGLVLKDGMVRDLNSADFGANTPFGLENEEGQEETYPPASFAVLVSTVYSYTATIAALDALLIPAA